MALEASEELDPGRATALVVDRPRFLGLEALAALNPGLMMGSGLVVGGLAEGVGATAAALALGIGVTAFVGVAALSLPRLRAVH